MILGLGSQETNEQPPPAEILWKDRLLSSPTCFVDKKNTTEWWET